MQKNLPSLKLVINGSLSGQSKDTTVAWDFALNEVPFQGGIGFSQGPESMTISGTLLIPNDGPDFNPVQLKGQEVDVQGFAGPLSFTTVGRFTEAQLEAPTVGEMVYSYTIRADFAAFE